MAPQIVISIYQFSDDDFLAEEDVALLGVIVENDSPDLATLDGPTI